MIDKEMLKILVCPRDHTPLDLADEPLLAKLNQAVAAGKIQNSAGDTLHEPVEGGLVRRDKTLLYPIVDDIPLLLVDEAVPLDQIEES